MFNSLMVANSSSVVGVSDVIVTSLQVIASEAGSAIGAVAPVAIGLSGTFMVWRLSVNFFKSLARG
ncbi:MAG: hypothetical protein R3Y64_09405 [Peptostreptococcaceae bacterium]